MNGDKIVCKYVLTAYTLKEFSLRHFDMSVKQKWLAPEWYIHTMYLKSKYTVAITTSRKYDFPLQPFLSWEKNLSLFSFYRAPRSVISDQQCSGRLHFSAPGYAHGGKFKYSRSQIWLDLKAAEKSPDHSTAWPWLKFRLLLLVSKSCILACIECRT